VAFANQQMRQAEDAAGTDGFRGENAVFIGGQVRVDLIQCFRTVYTGSPKQPIGCFGG